VKIPSTLLARFQQVFSKGTILEGGELVPDIPPVFTPIVSIPFPLFNRFGSFATGVLNDSVSIETSSIITKPASTAGSIATMITLARGLYLIECLISAWGNFTQANGSAPQFRLFIQDSFGTNNDLLSAFLIANTPINIRSQNLYLIPDDNWLLQNSIGATGAAQTLDALIIISAARLL
jgi:hypothetical protein